MRAHPQDLSPPKGTLGIKISAYDLGVKDINIPQNLYTKNYKTADINFKRPKQVHEKMFDISNYYRNVNQNHNEVSPDIC